MARKVSMDGVAAEIVAALAEFAAATKSDMQEAVDRVARESVRDVKSNVGTAGLKRSGDYQRSWGQKKIDGNGHSTTYAKVVYSKDRYALVHLLENGHLTRSGKRQKVTPHIVAGVAHVAPVADAAADKLMRYIREAMGGG